MKGRREPITSRLRGMGVARNRAAGDSEPAHKVRDEELVRALYAEHAAALLRFTLRMTDGDRQRAEDIVQETLLRAWLHPEAIAERPARPWLFAVARNLAVDAHRARKARPMEVGEGALNLVPVPDEADRVLESWAVADALAALRPTTGRFCSRRTTGADRWPKRPSCLAFPLERSSPARSTRSGRSSWPWKKGG